MTQTKKITTSHDKVMRIIYGWIVENGWKRETQFKALKLSMTELITTLKVNFMKGLPCFEIALFTIICERHVEKQKLRIDEN